MEMNLRAFSGSQRTGRVLSVNGRNDRKPVRSVAQLPELLSASYRNRVRKLSPRNQNPGVKHLPGSHTRTGVAKR